MIKKLEKRLRQIIIKNATISITEDDINDETDLINDLGFDSVQIMNFIIEIENEYGFEFEDDYLSLEVLGKYKNLKKVVEASII